MNSLDIRSLVERVSFPGYRFATTMLADGGFLVWARFRADCTLTGEKNKEWTTRKWYVSQFSCESEVVGTLLKIVLTSLEHEARESFKYDGIAVFDPHTSVRALSEIVKAKRIDIRKAAPVKTPYFPGTVAPARAGVYELRGFSDSKAYSTVFARYDPTLNGRGGWWHLRGSPSAAAHVGTYDLGQFRPFRRLERKFDWRGFTSDQSADSHP